MRKYLKHILSAIFIAFISYVFALFWWGLWMNKGFVGPIPFLHWVVQSDGEGSYFLTELEMFTHVFAVALGAYVWMIARRKDKV